MGNLNRVTGFKEKFWAAFLSFGFVVQIFSGGVVEGFAVFRLFCWWTVPAALLMIAFVISGVVVLNRLVPFGQWTWLRLFRADSANLTLAPLRIPWFSWIFLLLLLLNLPILALTEERIFRQGLSTWPEGILVSLLFGFAHCVVGVSLNVGLVLSVAGLWFTVLYWHGGLEFSAMNHAAYNLILGLGFIIILLDQHREYRKGGVNA